MNLGVCASDPRWEFQKRCADEAVTRNLLVVLPTGMGKTIIAAEVIRQVVSTKKVVFLAPSRPLAIQQYEVLAELVGALEPEETLGLCIGNTDQCLPFALAFKRYACVVATPRLLLDALEHGKVAMSSIGLLVFDEAHHLVVDQQRRLQEAWKATPYSLIMRYFYWSCKREHRPRVLGLTASPVVLSSSPCEERVATYLDRMEQVLDAAAWALLPSESSEKGDSTFVLRYKLSFAESCWACQRVMAALLSSRDVMSHVSEEAVGEKALLEVQREWDGHMELVTHVGNELGAWACRRAAHLLRDELLRKCSLGLCFYADGLGDEGDFFYQPVEGDQARPQEKGDLKEAMQRLRMLGAKALDKALSSVSLEADGFEGVAAVSPKVRALVGYLVEKKPVKTIVFATQRLLTRLLAEMLQEVPACDLGHSKIDWVVGAGPGRGRGGAATTTSQRDQGRKLDRFRLAPGDGLMTRVLVATTVLSEGIDVPSCDAVVRFERATNCAEFIQSKGRARDLNSIFVQLIAEGDAEGSKRLDDFRHFEKLVVAELRERVFRGYLRNTDTQSYFEFESPSQLNALTVAATGACLPIEDCVGFLKSVVYSPTLMIHGKEEVELVLTGSGRKFTSKKKHGHTNFHVRDANDQIDGTTPPFTCEIFLERIGLCDVQPAELFHGLLLPRGQACVTKAEAIACASLSACAYLHRVGVLNDHLEVSGRWEFLRMLRNHMKGSASRAGRRTSHRRNQYELHTLMPNVRRLPRCLQPHSEGLGEWWASPWLHRLKMGGGCSELALLLPQRVCTTFTVHHRPDAVQCTIYPVKRVELSLEQRDLLCEWRVGTSELVQASAVGESSHPSLRAPRQLMRFDRGRGLFVPERLAYEDPSTQRVAQAAHPVICEEWNATKASGANEVRGLTALISRLVGKIDETRGEQQGAAAPSVVVVLDLDHTVWPFSVAEEVDQSKVEDLQLTSDGSHVWDGERLLPLHDEAPLVLRALSEAVASLSPRLLVAVASLSPSEHSCAKLLDTIDAPVAISQIHSAPDKRAHLERIAEEARVPLDRLLLLDDETAHVDCARELGCSAVKIDRHSGLTPIALLRGLDAMTSCELAEEAIEEGEGEGMGCEEGGAAVISGDDFTQQERKIERKETRRKTRQRRQGMEAQAGARRTTGPVAAAKLKELEAPAGCWMLAPLQPGGGEEECCGLIDWDFVKVSCELFRTAEWPTLEMESHPLVEFRPCQAEEGARGDGEGGGGRGEGRLLLTCALAHRKPLLSRALILSNVVVSHDGKHVSGNYQPRAFASKLRIQGNVGAWTTVANDLLAHREGGYSPCEVRALPLRRAHVRTLQSLRRILWRLEHVMLVVEGARRGGDSALPPIPAGRGFSSGGEKEAELPSWWPQGSLPVKLPILCQALVQSQAAAEGLVGSLRVPSREGLGTADLEELEWIGDAALRLLAVMATMASRDEALRLGGEGVISPAAESILQNMTLSKRALELGYPELTLARPFERATSLPEQRRQLMTRKAHADVVEALLGAIVEAQLPPLSQQGVEEKGDSYPGKLDKPPLGKGEEGIAQHGGGKEGKPHPGAGEVYTPLPYRGGEGEPVVRREEGTPPPGGEEVIEPYPSPLAPGSLTSALAAGKAFFDACIHPAAHQSLSVAQALCSTMTYTSNTSLAPSAAMVKRASAIRSRLLPTTTSATDSVRDRFLYECVEWSRREPFQRLEFLGDAVLQYVVSVEVRRHWPLFDKGQLSTMRSALVSNKHLAGLLVRRLKRDLTIGFFNSLSEENRSTITQFTEAVSPDPVPPSAALLTASISSRARGQGEGGVGGERRDVRSEEKADAALKKIGDVYEALCGAVLLILGGDLDAWWAVFRADFFPSGMEAGEAKLLSSLMRARDERQATEEAIAIAQTDEARAALKEKLASLLTTEREALQRNPALRAGEHSQRVLSAAPSPTPMETAPINALDSVASKSPPRASDSHGEMSCAQDRAVTLSRESPEDVCSARSAPILQESAFCCHASSPRLAALNSLCPNPIGELHQLIAKRGLQLADVIVEDPSPATALLAPFAFELRLQSSSNSLALSWGHTRKKGAKRAAYLLAWDHQIQHQVIDHLFATVATNVCPSPPNPMLSGYVEAKEGESTPKPNAATPHACIDSTSAKKQRLIMWGSESTSGNAPSVDVQQAPAPSNLDVPMDKVSLSPHPSLTSAEQQRCHDMREQRFLELLMLSTSWTSGKQDLAATHEQWVELFELLSEENHGYQGKLQRMLSKSGLSWEAIWAIAQRAHQIVSSEGWTGPSAGRMVMEVASKSAVI